MLFSLKAEGKAAEQSSEEGKLHVLVKRLHGFRDSPLHSELIINGETVDIFAWIPVSTLITSKSKADT